MPLARISHRSGKPAGFAKEVSAAVHEAMIAHFDVPRADLFHIVTEHVPGKSLIASDGYLGIDHTDDLVFVQLTVSAGRSLEKKKALFEAIAANVARTGIRPEDVIINLIETAKENWSFGLGKAQYAA